MILTDKLRIIVTLHIHMHARLPRRRKCAQRHILACDLRPQLQPQVTSRVTRVPHIVHDPTFINLLYVNMHK